MSSATTISNKNEDYIISPLVSALMIVMFLFFIDEGYYDFRWMLEWGNWIVFFIYLAALFPIQWVIFRFLFRRQEGWKKIAFSWAVGIPLTLLMMYGVIALLRT